MGEDSKAQALDLLIKGARFRAVLDEGTHHIDAFPVEADNVAELADETGSNAPVGFSHCFWFLKVYKLRLFIGESFQLQRYNTLFEYG